MTPRARSENTRFEKTAHDGIYLHRQSGNFWIRDTVHIDADRKQLVDRSLKTDKISVAVERAKAVRAQIIRGEAAAGQAEQSFAEAFDLVLKMKRTKSDKTYQEALSQIKHLRRWFCGQVWDRESRTWIRDLSLVAQCPVFGNYRRQGSNRVWNFERDFEELWAEYKDAQELLTPGRQLWHDRRMLVNALKRAENKGWTKKAFTKKSFEWSGTTEPIGKYIEAEDVTRLLEACSPYPKLHLQVLMAVSMGMRISEVLHINKAEIDLKRRWIDLNPKRVKTRKRREVPIPVPDYVWGPLMAFYEAAKGPYLFPAEHHNLAGREVDWNAPQDDNRYHWDIVREATGLDVRFHDLRHTAATNMMKAGFPETGIRKIVGMSEATFRRIYAHIEDELRERFRGLFNNQLGGLAPKPQEPQ